MGSRALVALCRDEAGAAGASARARRGPGRSGPAPAAPSSPTGPLSAVLDRSCARRGCRGGLWEDLATDWLLLDAEIMPWSAKALEPDRASNTSRSPWRRAPGSRRRSTRRAGRRARGVAVDAARGSCATRLAKAERWRRRLAALCLAGPRRGGPACRTLHLLASEGAVHFDKDHPGTRHGGAAGRRLTTGDLRPHALARTSPSTMPRPAPRRSPGGRRLTAGGGEGMVVKPLAFVPRGAKGGLIQPAIKVRGRSICASSTGLNTTCPTISSASGNAASAASAPWPCASSPWGTKPWRASSPRTTAAEGARMRLRHPGPGERADRPALRKRALTFSPAPAARRAGRRRRQLRRVQARMRGRAASWSRTAAAKRP